MIKKLLNKRIITIKYSNLLISDKSTEFTFSLANVVNNKLLDQHLKEMENREFIKNHKFLLKIPNSVFKLNLSTNEILLERWWFDLVKETFFINSEQAKLLKISSIRFRNVVRHYLSKNY